MLGCLGPCLSPLKRGTPPPSPRPPRAKGFLKPLKMKFSTCAYLFETLSKRYKSSRCEAGATTLPTGGKTRDLGHSAAKGVRRHGKLHHRLVYRSGRPPVPVNLIHIRMNRVRKGGGDGDSAHIGREGFHRFSERSSFHKILHPTVRARGDSGHRAHSDGSLAPSANLDKASHMLLRSGHMWIAVKSKRVAASRS